jgi:transcriptional regulator with XRE-family HTH domain
MRTPIEQYIIDKVRETRIAARVSQESLAYSLGFESKGYISMIEGSADKYNESYNVNHLNAIAKILKCSPKDFWPLEPL